MFCGNCGTENEPGAKFCKSCGQPIVMPNAQANPQPNVNPVNNINTAAIGDKLKKIDKKFYAIGAAVLVVLIVIIAVAVNNANTINLNKYVKVTCSGYDGYGTVTAEVDWSAIENKYGDKIKIKNNYSDDDLGALSELFTGSEVLSEYIDIEVDKDSGLSNGDEVTYTWSVDSDYSKYIKCKIKYSDGSYTVDGLESVETYDAFEGVTVEFSGVAPDGYAKLDCSDAELDSYYYSLDKYDGLSNGDVVTLSIDDSYMEDMAETYGRIPKEFSKEYEVTGLGTYVTKAEELENGLDDLKSQCQDVFASKVQSDWEDEVTLKSMDYIGNYLLTTKSDDYNDNRLYMVYKVTANINVTGDDGANYNQDTTYYWYVEFFDLMVDDSDEVDVELTNYNIPYDSFEIETGVSDGWWDKDYYIDGYQTLDELYADAVTYYADSYNHEDNVSE